jgi:hypothetical protein
MTTSSTESGRKPLGYISARLSEPERVRLLEVAALTDRTPSAVVRRALRLYTTHLEAAEQLLANGAASRAEEEAV